MKSTTGWIRAGLAVLALTVAAPVAAQDREATLDEIEKIEAKAFAHLKDADSWNRAASMFRRAAALRPAGDPRAVQDLLRAGRLAFYEGHERKAVSDFEGAGERALERGDVITAANAFVDAAWVARSNRDAVRASSLLGRARLLARSPLLENDERALLSARWEVAGIQ